jgi:predicted RNase H-like HicB family nuclease
MKVRQEGSHEICRHASRRGIVVGCGQEQRNRTARYAEEHPEEFRPDDGGSMKYAILIERSDTGYGAYAPDLPGLGVTGESIEEVRSLISRGIALYVRELRDRGEAAPKPTALAEYAEIELVA